MAEYRKLVSALNRELGTAEVHMCGASWEDIEPGAISAKCLTKHRRALRNEPPTPRTDAAAAAKKRLRLPSGEKLRHPDSEDRNACRAKLLEHLAPDDDEDGAKKKKKRVHGAASQPHELVADYVRQLLLEEEEAGGADEVEEDVVVEAQWADLVASLQAKLGEGLGKLVPVVDLAYSEEASLVAVLSLAVLSSQCAPPPFRGRVLTFASQPVWPVFPAELSLLARLRLLVRARHNSSGSSHSAASGATPSSSSASASAVPPVAKDLEKCVRTMLSVCVEHGVSAAEVESLRLLVLSDMAFETSWASPPPSASSSSSTSSSPLPPAQSGPYVTQHEALTQAFAQAGYPALPELVYWNVATKALSAGETYRLPLDVGSSKPLVLELASDSSILCGACLAFSSSSSSSSLPATQLSPRSKNGCVGTCCYTTRRTCDGSLRHLGDTMVNGCSKHRIEVDLHNLPKSVDFLFFSLCACGPADLSEFERPYISLSDGATQGNLCRYQIAGAKGAPSALMACVARTSSLGALGAGAAGGGADGGGWGVVALGDNAKVKCCENYDAEMKGMCASRLRELAMGFTVGGAGAAPKCALADERGGEAEEGDGGGGLGGFLKKVLGGLMLKAAAATNDEDDATATNDEDAKDGDELEEVFERNASKKAKVEEARDAGAGAASPPPASPPALVLPVEASTRGVRLLSGFSAGMLGVLVEGDEVAHNDDEKKPSAAARLRQILRGERYRAVREAVAEVGEGVLAGYAV